MTRPVICEPDPVHFLGACVTGQRASRTRRGPTPRRDRAGPKSDAGDRV